MFKLVRGVRDFHDNMLPQLQGDFKAMANGQSPDTVLWACIDSRVVPNVFGSTNPGDLNVVRNPGNIVPPFGHAASGSNAALSLATRKFPIKDMIVCGHSNCGAMATLLQWTDVPWIEKRWFRFASEAKRMLKEGVTIDSSLDPVDQLSQLNVLVQLSHLWTYPNIEPALVSGAMHMHGWWFQISTGKVMSYEPEEKLFVTIDQAVETKIIERLKKGESSYPSHNHPACHPRLHAKLMHRPNGLQRFASRAMHFIRNF